MRCDQRAALGDVDRLGRDVRLGRAAAVPVEVVAAGAPAAAVVLADGDDEDLRAVGALDVLEGAAHGQLPADVGLDLERAPCRCAPASWCRAQPAPPAKPVRLRKMQAPSTTRVLRAPSSSFSVTPFLRARLRANCHVSGVSIAAYFLVLLLVGLVGEVRAEDAAAVVGLGAVDAVAAAAVDAGPAAGEPGEVAAVDAASASAGSGNSTRRAGSPAAPRRGASRATSTGRTSCSSSVQPRATLGARTPTAHVAVQPGDAPSIEPCASESSTSVPTPSTCWWSTRTTVPRRCPAHSHKTELRLAEHIVDGERISAHGRRHARRRSSHSAQDVAEDFGVTEMTAFATSAIREATNGEDVLREVRERTGVDLLVLSGDDEARLTFLAVRRWYGWSSGRLLVLDIGGGSLEIAVGADEVPDVAVSLPLGAGRLTPRASSPTTRPAPEDVKAMRKHARATIADVDRPHRPRRRAAPRRRHEQDLPLAGPHRRRRAVQRGPVRTPDPRARRPARCGSPSSRP